MFIIEIQPRRNCFDIKLNGSPVAAAKTYAAASAVATDIEKQERGLANLPSVPHG